DSLQGGVTDAGRASQADAADHDVVVDAGVVDTGIDDGGNCALLDPGSAIVPVFVDAGPYTYELGPSARNAAHAFPNENPAGQRCIAWHSPGGAAQPCLCAGAVSGGAGGGVEVRIRNLRGTTTSVHTDLDGNFCFLLENAPQCFELPVRGGLRNEKGEKTM